MNAYANLPDISNAVPRSPADDALFAEIAAVLDRHGARDRFGVTLLHTHFPLREGEVLVEETDVDARVQRIVPAAAAPEHAIETAWHLGSGGQAIVECYCRKSMDGTHYGHKKAEAA